MSYLQEVMDSMERQFLLKVAGETRNRKQLARDLGISYRTLLNHVSRLGLGDDLKAVYKRQSDAR